MVRNRIPEERVINVTEARRNFSSLINDVARDEAIYVVEKNGLEAVYIVGRNDFERLRELDREERERRKRLLDGMAETAVHFADVPLDELERQIEIATQEARLERWQDEQKRIEAGR